MTRAVRDDDRDRGSVTPLIFGFFVIVMLMVWAVSALGGIFLARQNLQSLCDGAADAAANHIEPGVTGVQQSDEAQSAATDYLSLRGAGATARVTGVDDDRVSVTCGETFHNPLAGMFVHLFGSDGHTPAAEIPLEVQADSRPVFRD
jgi:Flp pilus assembly protein TadG